jgi:hypothetical protein
MTNNSESSDVAGPEQKPAQSRPAQAGETGTTRFGMEPGDNSEVPATGNSDAPLGATPAPHSHDGQGGAGGLATGLQSGGIIPGGGPGAMVGSLGTGGGSNANRATGDADENNIEEDVR